MIHYLVSKQPINTRTMTKGLWSVVRVDESGDHTTLGKNLSADEAYAAAQADATAQGQSSTYIRRLED